ncbi:MAG: alpha/beta hydrolase [Ruminococcus flavefaciens]|nr:alpha/beta hydrolase [Ruminococcus flavefaciens]MCM1230313.1 alpha/beta hydrolase [Ruminococcus flavefaciens]
MELFTKMLRGQISAVNKIADVCSSEKSHTVQRALQDKIGGFMAHEYIDEVTYEAVESDKFQAEYVIPNRLDYNGVILYLHGGGYVSGDLQYAKGFGTILAVQNNIRVCCLAYRLAPENPYPSALDDAVNAYRKLMEDGFSPSEIILCGESSGGGLAYALALKLKDMGIGLPSGIIAISPWTDLTMSGESYETNSEADPSMTRKRLECYARCYTDNPHGPFVSPISGDLTGLPPSLIFVGGDEVMLSDSADLHAKLCNSGCSSKLHIAPEMWHIYLLYGTKQAKEDIKLIPEFVKEIFNGK